MDETIIICRSNKRANLYNNGIRNTILYREDELNTGDILMVAKNNYFWGADVKELDFIANGDIAEVRRVRRIHEMYGFRFADVLLSFPDYGDIELETKVLLDTLHSDSPALTKEESDRLFYAVLEDYQDIPTKRERMKKMKRRDLPQSARRAMEAGFHRPRLYSRRYAYSRLLPLALHRFHTCYRNLVLGEFQAGK